MHASLPMCILKIVNHSMNFDEDEQIQSIHCYVMANISSGWESPLWQSGAQVLQKESKKICCNLAKVEQDRKR